MASKQPMHLLTDPSGYVSPVVWPISVRGYQSASPNISVPGEQPIGGISVPGYQPVGSTPEGIAGSINVQSHSPIPVPTSGPARGFRLFGGIRFPFSFHYTNIGINAWRAGSI